MAQGKPVGGDTLVDLNAEFEAPSRVLVEQYGRPVAHGDVLFREGDPATHAYVIFQGRVRLLKRVGLAERSVAVLRAGELFGESALLEGVVRRSTAVALSEGTLLALDRAAIRSVIERFPAIGQRLMAQLVKRLGDAEDQIEVLLMRDNSAKVVSALLKMVRGSGAAAELAVSPIELSARVGLDVDTVKRAVRRLREQQYVRVDGERIEIPDVDALRRLSVLLNSKEELRGDR